MYNVVTLNQANPAGAVFEVAGRHTRSGLARNLTDWHGPASRALWRAADARRSVVLARVTAATEAAERALNARIARGGGA
jgi:hypothetical protein